MTLKTEFTVIWLLHYTSIIFPLPRVRLRSSHPNMAVEVSRAVKRVSDGLRDRNGERGGRVLENTERRPVVTQVTAPREGVQCVESLCAV